MIGRRIFATLLLGSALIALGCKGEESRSGSGNGNVSLLGAGATFPYPLYSKWLYVHHGEHPNIKINYQSIGSGGGIRQVIAGTVDFGASDAPMSESEAKKAPRKLVHIPTTIGAVAVSYNVPGIKSGLKLTPEALAGIFLGTITKWNDAKIREVNPGASLPDQNIAVVYRSDGSGTTAVFTDYLAAISPTWKTKVGAGKSVKWPAGLGAKGNEGVTGQLKTTPGSIGYVELAYATQSKLPVVALKNQAGQFVGPDLDAVTAAAKGVQMPDSLHVSLVDAKGDGAYPISAYTYILAYEQMKDLNKAKALTEFLWWAIHDGQKYAKALHYAPLPSEVVKKIEHQLKQFSVGGKTLLSGV